MQIQYSDRSFQYGDGVFTTIRIRHGQPELWPLHWQRLQLSMQRLGFAELSEDVVLSDVINTINAQQQVLKVLISRGQGARGYGCQGIIQPQLYCWTAELPDYARARSDGLRLGLAQLQLSKQPLLAGIKHCSRLETILLKREAEQSIYDDLVVSDQDGFLVEATASNLLMLLDQQWVTPALSNAGVAGVMRQLLLEQGWVVERPVPVAALEQVQSLGLCNALMGVVPIVAYAARSLDLAPVRRLQIQVDELLQER